MLLIGVGMTGNAWKWLEIVGKGCMRAIYGSNWLICLEMARNGWKWIGNWWKWMEIARNGMARKCFVEYHSHVQSYVAAALAWEMPLRISDHGIPFPNWDVLLSRHQLGATWLTVWRVSPEFRSSLSLLSIFPCIYSLQYSISIF